MPVYLLRLDCNSLTLMDLCVPLQCVCTVDFYSHRHHALATPSGHVT